jgi:CRP/FNR family transcriptional regulator, cyclic AMP receptor protein
MSETAERQSQLIALLGATPLFSGLDSKHLARLARIGSEESYKKGDAVFHQGDQGDTFYLVLEGAVRISREVAGLGEEALAVLRAGAAFGEMALIDDAPRSADVLVHESCRLFVVRKSDLEDLLFLDRDLAHDFLWQLVRILAGRLRETTDKMMFLTFAGKFS